MLLNRKLMNIILKENPETYSYLRLRKELEHTAIRNIVDSLEFEISLYEEVPQMIFRNYETVEHFLAYISEVKKYKETLEQTGDSSTDI